jgi:hypothetical protein
MRRFAYLKEPEHCFFTQRHAADAGNRTKVQRAHDTFLSMARCPLCRAPLVARMSRRGPYFHCLCIHGAPATEAGRGA